jgi:hypothetical protein
VKVEMPFDDCTDLRKVPDDKATITTEDDGLEHVTWDNGYTATLHRGWALPLTG